MDLRSTSEGPAAWEGTCKQLLQHLESVASEGMKKSPGWPKTPRGLSSRLRRIATFMREAGIEITFHPKGPRGERLLTISEVVQTTAATATTASSEAAGSPNQPDAPWPHRGGSTTGDADTPQPPHEPPLGYPIAKSSNGYVNRSLVAEEAVEAVVCRDSFSSKQINLCASCGAVDWIWEGGAWVCPLCHQPARS
jgi:hypothetical protein